MLLPDLLILAALGAILCGVLAYAALQPSTRFTFAVDEQPAAVQFHAFYGLERNAAGPYRWSKPEAAIILPVNAPGRYRATLTLQDGAPSAERRAATIYGNGAALATVDLDKAPRGYAIEYELGTRAWVGRARQTLQIELQTATYLPDGDARALGVVVRHVAVERLPPTNPSWPTLLLPALAILGVVYAALRALALGPAIAAAPILAAAGLVAVTPSPRAAALIAAYQPLANPLRFGLLLLGLVAVPTLARAVTVLGPTPPEGGAPSAGTTRAPLSGLAARMIGQRAWGDWLVVAPILALAAGLRLYRYDRLSLWLDEGATAYFARLSWRRVLGFEGWYDLHPPLYYAGVKLVTLLVPAANAGRLISVVTGTLTVLVLYALTARLLNRLAAIVAGLALALSPLHVWYSQEARMYTPSVLFVGLSYLALVAFLQQPPGPRAADRAGRWWWATVYGMALALAMYTVYSSLYALLPQIALLAFIVWRQRRRAAPILVGLTGAVLAYLPWVPQALSTVRASNEIASRGGYLSATPARVKDSLLSLSGLGGGLGVYSEWRLTPWARSGPWQPLLLALILVALGVGVIGLARRRPVAPLVAGALSAGTVGVAILVSQFSPGYADRTILYATLGWSMIVGAAGWTLVRPSLWQRGLGVLCLLLILAVSASSLDSLYRAGKKQNYRGLINETTLAVSLTDRPVIPLGSWMTGFLSAYTPNQGGRVARLTTDGRVVGADGLALETDALWLAYSDYPWDNIATARQQLAALGYERLMHKYYRDPLYLDLYARPGAWPPAGAPVESRLPTDAARAPDAGWSLPPTAALRPGAGDEGAHLVLTDGAATFTTGATGAALYALQLDLALGPDVKGAEIILACLDRSGTVLAASSPATAPLPAGSWRTLRAAALCPEGSTALRLTARGGGRGEARIREPRIVRLSGR